MNEAGGRRGIDTVLLDVGGLLLLPEHRSVLAALATAGAGARTRDLDAVHYRALAACEDAEGQPPGFAAGHYWVEYARAAGVPEQHLEQAACAIEEVQARRPLFTRAVPGCRAGLQAIAATGVRIVLVSNTEHGHVEEALGRLGICQIGPGPGVVLRGVVDSHVVGIAKPNPAIFALALVRAGGQASRALHVGDSRRADVEGAGASGIWAMHFDPLGLCQRPEHPHAASLTAVAAWILGNVDQS